MVRPMRVGRAGALLPAFFAVMVPIAGCRREAPKPAAAAPPPAAVESADVATRERRPPGPRAPVIWLGLDGLDFELLDRLAAEGKMPNWKRLAAEGYTARLS